MKFISIYISYGNRLRFLNIPSLAYRKKHGDMIKMYNIDATHLFKEQEKHQHEARETQFLSPASN